MGAFELYLDEAGYTGADLINREQPVYTLAAIALSGDAARDLVARCFPGVKARELRHSALTRKSRGRQQILDFIHALAAHPESVSITVVHKECVLLGRLIDGWIETVVKMAGGNLYERGANISLMNVTYITLGTLLGADGRREFLRRFQVMMRDRTVFAYESFWGTVDDLCRDHPAFVSLFAMYQEAERRLGIRYLWGLPQHALDIADIGLLDAVTYWREKTPDRLLLIHDNSPAMARKKPTWEKLLTADVPPAIVGQDRRVTKFPLNADLRLADSASHLQLQLADLIAGATTTMLVSNIRRPAEPSDYVEALKRSPLPEYPVAGSIWPTDRITPQELGTEGPSYGDAADYMATLLSRAPTERDEPDGQ